MSELKNIKLIRFKGELEVTGIFNYNETGKRKGHNNHNYAKCIKIKTVGKTENEEHEQKVDYTSSRCLRHEIFKDLAPRQPSDEQFKENFIQMAASELGLVRGYLHAEQGTKRASAVSIHDAYTEKFIIGNIEVPINTESTIHVDQGVSSKPKTPKKSVKDEAGEEEVKSGTSIFSKDNAPRRIQNFEGAINIRQLQFLELAEKDSDFRVVNKESEEEYINLLKANFKNPNIVVNNYLMNNSFDKTVWRGVLLPDDVVTNLIVSFCKRLKFLESYKTSASLRMRDIKFLFINDNHEEAKACTFKSEDNIFEFLESTKISYSPFLERK